jgi:hypothetical protein
LRLREIARRLRFREAASVFETESGLDLVQLQLGPEEKPILATRKWR